MTDNQMQFLKNLVTYQVPNQIVGELVSLIFNCSSEHQFLSVLDRLLEDGKVLYPIKIYKAMRAFLN
jgi:hypothetical protein